MQSGEYAMSAIKTNAYQASTERQQLAKASEARSDAQALAAKKTAEKAAAAKAAENRTEQQPTTNNQGQTIGSRLNVSA